MHRAYSLLSVKAIDETRRTFSGTATTPTPDTQGDIIDPLGVSFRDPMPLLLHHDKERPVGLVHFHPPTPAGIDFTAEIPVITEPGTLKDRVDEAWQSVKTRLITGVSVRVNAKPDGVKPLKGGGLHWLKSWVNELSLVTLGSNPDATINTIKSLDTGFAATGMESAIEALRQPPSGASDPQRATRRTERTMKQSPTERITAMKATKDTKVVRMNELANADDGTTMDAAQQEEFDTLETEVKAIDADLSRLARLEQLNKASAKTVDGSTPEGAAASRGGTVVSIKDVALPPGIRFARYAMCVAQAKGNRSEALEISRARYPSEHGIHDVLKAAVAAGTTTDATWAGNLVQYQDFLQDFIEYLRPQTILGKFGQGNIPALQKVPFNVRVFSQTTGGEAYWTGEGKPKPLTKFGFSTVTMQWNKVANIAVLTQEEVRFSSPSAEARVRDSLAKAIIARIDQDFVDPANAGTSGVKPASITSGIAATAPTGTDADHFRTDFASALGGFVTNNLNVTNLVAIMSGTTALALSLMRNSLGIKEFPDLTLNGGSIEGIPVIVSQYVASLGSPSTGMIVIVSADDILLADDGQVVIDASDQASLEMLDASLVQDATAGTGTSLVSLWQNNLLGLRAERFITWKLARAAAVSYLSPVAYVA